MGRAPGTFPPGVVGRVQDTGACEAGVGSITMQDDDGLDCSAETPTLAARPGDAPRRGKAGCAKVAAVSGERRMVEQGLW
jgi:hypothetical protein